MRESRKHGQEAGRLAIRCSSIIVVLAVGLLGVSESAAQERAFVPEHVIVPFGSVLHLEPRETASTIELGRAGERPDGVVFRRVSQRGPWSELVNDDLYRGRHCYDGATSGGIAVRFWVLTKSLATVTTRPVEVTFSDGSRVSLQEGVIIADADTGVTRAWLGRAAPHVNLDESALGKSYLDVSPTRAGRRDGELLESSEGLFAGSSNVLLSGAARVNTAKDQPDKVDLRLPCGSIRGTKRALAAKKRPPKKKNRKRIGAVGFGGKLETGRSPPQWRHRRGAQLTWPDGSPAGKTIKEATVYAEARKASDGRLCLSLRLNADRPAKLEVCFAQDDIERSDLSIGGIGNIHREPKRSPRVSVGDPTTYGPIHPRDVEGVLDGARGRLRQCAREGPKAAPASRTSELTVFRVVVDKQAQTSVVLRRSAGEEAIEQCLLTTLQPLSFPKPDGKVTLELPVRIWR